MSFDQSIPFQLGSNSPYVCQRCRTALKNAFQARDKVHKLERELKELHLEAGYPCDYVSSKACVSSGSQNDQEQKHANEIKTDKAVQTNMTFETSTSQETVAFVYVCWPSGDRIRKLPSDLTKMAIYLLRTQNIINHESCRISMEVTGKQLTFHTRLAR